MFDAVIEELKALSQPELDAVIAETELAKRAAQARQDAAVAVVAGRASYRDEGYRSMTGYLTATLNCSRTHANKIKRRAHLVNHHVEVGEALAAGHVGVEQVDRLAVAHAHPRAGEQFADFAPLLLEHAEHLEYNDFDNAVQRFITLADTDGAFDDQKFREDQRTASVSEHNGSITAQASGGSPQQAVEIARVFELAVRAEFERDCDRRRAEFGDAALDHPLPRNADQRRFDAFHQIFMSYATVPADGKTPEPLVNIVIDHVTAGQLLAEHGLVDTSNVLGGSDDAFEAAAADPAHRHCQTTTGTAVHPDVALRALIVGRVRRAIVDADNVVIDLGRTQRLFTGKARQAAQLLVTSCTHRGCDVPATLCDVDHRTEWVSGNGATDQSNAMPLCGAHDRWKHANTIRSRRAVNGRLFLIRPDGSTILPVGAREPQWAEPPPFRAIAA